MSTVPSNSRVCKCAHRRFQPFDVKPEEPWQVNNYLLVHGSTYCWVELVFAILLLAVTLVEAPTTFSWFPWQLAASIDACCIVYFAGNVYYRGMGIGATLNPVAHPRYCTKVFVIVLLIVNLGLQITCAHALSKTICRVRRRRVWL